VVGQADEAVLSSMIANLLDNAITFIQPGGQVQMAAKQQDSFIVVTISDNGPGVTATDLERILRPFEQAGSVNEHAKGSGLGLTLVKAFAELHGGTLALSSVPGEGFSARLALPALPA
jgi:signal transduction histidine kinase